MGEKSTRLRTGLSVKNCAEVFRGMVTGGGLNRKLARMKKADKSDLDFFTPSATAFSSLEQDGPDFTVGASIPKFNGVMTTIQMYVWDRASYREVVLYAPFSLGNRMHADRLVGEAVAAFTSADPALERVG